MKGISPSRGGETVHFPGLRGQDFTHARDHTIRALLLALVNIDFFRPLQIVTIAIFGGVVLITKRKQTNKEILKVGEHKTKPNHGRYFSISSAIKDSQCIMNLCSQTLIVLPCLLLNVE